MRLSFEIGDLDFGFRFWDWDLELGIGALDFGLGSEIVGWDWGFEIDF